MQSAMSPSSLSSAAAAVSTSRRDVALQPPPIIPFVEFVLRALEHPHYMFVSKLAACCAMLYLARSDQELQLSLSHKWAVRFAMDRGRLLEVIRRRTRQHRSRLFGSEAMTGVTATATTASSSSSAAAAAADMSPTTSSSSPPAHDTATESKTAAVDALHTCDPSVVVEHLMRILDSLIPMYFSWNWHRIDYVIQLNKEYEAFVRENILPLCIASTAEDGVDDAAHTSWLVPSNIDSANHALLRFSQQQQQQQLASSSSSSSSTPVITSTFVRSNGAATASRQASPLTSDDNDNNNNNSSSSNNNNNSSSNNNSSDDNSKSKSSAVTTTRHADTLAPLPLSSAMGVLSPTTTPSTSTTVNKADADDNGAAAVGGGGGATSASNVSALPTFPVLDTTMSNNNNNKTDVVATGAATPAVRTHNNNSSMTLPATTTMVPSMVYSPTLGTPATEVPEAGLAFLTISNYAAALRDNHSGLVTIFHAKYSSKSVHVVRLFQRLVEQQLVSPMPVVAVVFAVAEPELSSLYNISWFPTIIYTPPSALLAVDTATTATAAGTAGSSVSPRESEHEAAAHRPTTSTVTRPAASSSPLHSPTRRTGEVATLSPSEMLFGFAVGGSSGGGNNNKNNNSRAVANMTSSAATATTAAAALSSVPVALASTMTDGDGGGGGGSNNNSRSSASAAAVSAATAHALSELSASDVLLLSDDGGGELTARVASDGHVVYPMHAPTTLDAFVAWLRSHGRDVPPAAAATAAAPLSGLTAAATTTASSLSSNGGGSTAAGGGVAAAAAAAAAASHLTARVNTMHAADKLKETGELRSAIVMLRRLQDSEAHRRLQSGGSSGNNTGNSGSARDRATAPLFIFLGGGMAAGKSTAAMALAQSAWWREHKDHSVLVNADEFKVAEPLYERAPADMHERSTRAAESLLVQAINQGRSTVLDGTMMWAPFVQQVIDMLRNAHTTLYTRGPGYRPGAEERYFVAVGRRPVPLPLPYVIRFIGITVDPEIAVPRGFVRKYATGRGVPISMQLRSFRLFAENFEKYAALVDATTLLNNNVFVDLKKGELPPVLAVCDESTGGKLRINDEAAYALFRKQRSLNEHAGNILELYV